MDREELVGLGSEELLEIALRQQREIVAGRAAGTEATARPS